MEPCHRKGGQTNGYRDRQRYRPGSSSDQLDIKPTVSGTIISVSKQSGDQVKAGDVIAQIDSTDAAKAVRDAQINLQTAQLAMQNLLPHPIS